MTRKVKKIPATLGQYSKTPLSQIKKKNVAGYARVSTDNKEQLSSYETQVNYYTKYINSKADWNFVKVYTDEGISGTSTKKREGFKSMVSDALEGKIDLIITKSVSRFARNTVDSLTTVRKLKEKGIEIYFEKENIWTLDSKGELLITIMSSLAQEESRSISENCTWGIRKKFEEGVVRMSYVTSLGYEKDKDGNIVINEREAKIVKYIYSRFLHGLTPNLIAAELEAKKVPNVRGDVKWYGSTIKNMLQNEKYTGNAILQKTYSVDFLSKKRLKNNGEITKYYVENSHPAIISQAKFDLVQEEFEKRGAYPNRSTSANLFSNRIVCGKCGALFGRKIWHSTDKYRKVVWQCNDKYKGEVKCDNVHLSEDEIYKSILEAINKIIVEKDEIIENCELILNKVLDTKKLKIKEIEQSKEHNKISKQIEQLVESNSTIINNPGDFNEDYNNLSAEYFAIQEKLEKTQAILADKYSRKLQIDRFLETIKSQDELVTDFSPKLFTSIVDIVEVFSKKEIKVHFKNGEIVVVDLLRRKK
ncbi:MAG: recombinase family protein [Sphaerochaetaceae bacterium]|nr:recombinase family protein [Sphaerochaetaceae bacterium]